MTKKLLEDMLIRKALNELTREVRELTVAVRSLLGLVVTKPERKQDEELNSDES